MNGFGRVSVSSRESGNSSGSPRSELSTFGSSVTPTTSKPPLKPLILASSAALVSRSNRTPVSENTTPLSTNSASGRRTLPRQPSALEIKYSPSTAGSSNTTTPAGNGKSPTPRLSLSPARLDSWSRPSSAYLSPATPSFGTSSRNARTPSPSLLSPSYRRSSTSPFSATSPLSKYFHDLPGRDDARELEALDDEDAFRRLSTYLEDPYQRSPEASPMLSMKGRTSGRKGNAAVGDVKAGRGLGVEVGRDWTDEQGGGRQINGGSRRNLREHTGTSSSSSTATNSGYLSSQGPAKTNSHHRTSRQAPLSKDIDSPTVESFSHRQSQAKRCDTRSPTSPRSPIPRSPEWLWETQPLPPLPCEPPRKSDILRGTTGRKGSLGVPLEMDGLPVRKEVSNHGGRLVEW